MLPAVYPNSLTFLSLLSSLYLHTFHYIFWNLLTILPAVYYQLFYFFMLIKFSIPTFLFIFMHIPNVSFCLLAPFFSLAWLICPMLSQRYCRHWLLKTNYIRFKSSSYLFCLVILKSRLFVLMLTSSVYSVSDYKNIPMSCYCFLISRRILVQPSVLIIFLYLSSVSYAATSSHYF